MSSNTKITVQVSGIRDSDKSKSIGCLVDLRFNEDTGNVSSASRLEWFPKSLCSLEEVEYEHDHFGKTVMAKKWFLTAPEWLLIDKKVKYSE